MIPVKTACRKAPAEREPETRKNYEGKGGEVFVFFLEPGCIFCEDPTLGKREIKTYFFHRYIWYQELWDMRSRLRVGGHELRDLLNVGVYKWKEEERGPKPGFVNIKDDPFNFDKTTQWRVRYFASVVRELYPPIYTEINGKKVYEYMFHPRGLYYRLGSSNYCIPYQARDMDSLDDLFERLNVDRKRAKDIRDYIRKHKLPLRRVIFMARSRLNRSTYHRINELLELARYAGLVPFDQVAERRVTLGVQPENPFNSIKKLEKKGEVRFNISLDVLHDIVVESPLILIYSEKNTITYVLDRLARKYVLSYYVGSGQISVTGAKQVYDYIKEHARFAIVLTVSDYDKAGFNIPVTFARKLQYFSALDPDPEDKKPSIIVHRFLIDEDTVEEILNVAKRKGLEDLAVSIIEEEKVEIEALENLVGEPGYEHCTTLADVVEMKLRTVFPKIRENPERVEGNVYEFDTPLIDADQVARISEQYIGEFKERVMKELKSLEQETRSAIEKELGKPIPEEFDDYIRTVESYIRSLVPVSELEKAIRKAGYRPLKVRGKFYLTEEITQQLEKFIERIDPDYAKYLAGKKPEEKVKLIKKYADLKQRSFSDYVKELFKGKKLSKALELLKKVGDPRYSDQRPERELYEMIKKELAKRKIGTKRYMDWARELDYIRVTRLLQLMNQIWHKHRDELRKRAEKLREA